MLKSWKTRALATAGAVALAAPFAFMGGAMAVPTATVTSVTPTNGPAGTSVTVLGNCGTTATEPATGAQLFLTGPTITAPAPGQAFGATVVAGSSTGDFTGTVTIPSGARANDVFTVTARCSDRTGTGDVSAAGPTFTVIDSGITGTVTGALSGTGTGGVTGTGLTSTSGATTAGATSAGTTTGSTTGGATPIPRQPNFTG